VADDTVTALPSVMPVRKPAHRRGESAVPGWERYENEQGAPVLRCFARCGPR
jgi:hypothetical protein